MVRPLGQILARAAAGTSEDAVLAKGQRARGDRGDLGAMKMCHPQRGLLSHFSKS